MSPTEVLRSAHKAGLEVSIAASGNLFVSPPSRLSDDMRVLLVTHKAEVIEFLRDAQETMDELIAMALAACDYWGDGDEARAEMLGDCANTPPLGRADLLEHLRQEYGGKVLRRGPESQSSHDDDP